MRWNGQRVVEDGVGAEVALPGLRGLLRSVRPPEFAGTVFHEVEAKSVLNRVPGPSPVPFRWTVNPYRGCSHACVYCLEGRTRVLLADGRTRAISELRVGDAVVGTERRGGCRRYVRTTVLAHWSTTKPAHRVRLADGTEILASAEHRFLTDRGWRHVRGGWCRSGRRPHLRVGSELLGPGPFAPARAHPAAYRHGYLCGVVRCDAPHGAFPSHHLELEALGRVHHFLALAGARSARSPVAAGGWAAGDWAAGDWAAGDWAAVRWAIGRGEPGPGTGRRGIDAVAPVPDLARWPVRPDADWCAGFLAGAVDARGTVLQGELRVRHSDEEVVGRVAGALHRLGFGFTVETDGPERAVRLLGGPASFLRFLQVTDPAVSRVRDLAGAPVTGGPAVEVESVQALGTELAMFDITTGTGDFVAEGVVSHNCFARGTHRYLDLDPGADFDSQIVVKVNAARVLERELRSPRWQREPVAMGTNTDPYQRAEGRYRLMPGVIGALARSGTPFSLLTKGTVLTRDLPLLAAAAADVPVNLGVSVALTDRALQARLEPGTPSPAARLDLVRRIADAGLPCEVLVAPVLPLLTDSDEALDALLGRIAEAGAVRAGVLALHLRSGTREWFLAWLAREHPGLVEPYARLYRRGAYVDPAYRRVLTERVAPLLRSHGLTGPSAMREQGTSPAGPAAPSGEQLSLL